MMKAAQQSGGGGGGQHGSLLAGGTALPGGPSPQPGQPGSLMQGGESVTVRVKCITSMNEIRDNYDKSSPYLTIIANASEDRGILWAIDRSTHPFSSVSSIGRAFLIEHTSTGVN